MLNRFKVLYVNSPVPSMSGSPGCGYWTSANSSCSVSLTVRVGVGLRRALSSFEVSKSLDSLSAIYSRGFSFSLIC